jgi:hypothetical protein
VPEGLSASEVGKEIAEHKKHAAAPADKDGEHHDRWLSILEALLLSLVAVLAAYSGYAAAKWGTESSVMLAKASAERTKANRADIEGIVTRTLTQLRSMPGSPPSQPETPTPSGSPQSGCDPATVRRSRPGWRPIQHTIPTPLPDRRTCRNT